MLNHTELPISFWLSLVALAVLALHAWIHRREAWGIPAMGVYGTVFAWYQLDAILNDYSIYATKFSTAVLDAAWWQVIGFTVSLAVLAPVMHGLVNASIIGRPSKVAAFLDGHDSLLRLQKPLVPAFRAAAFIWLAFSLIALWRTGFDWQGLFFPWLGHRAYPWARQRIGTGIEFLFSFVEYVNIFCLAVFGIVAALAVSRRLRNVAAVLVVLSWPYVLVDRARNIMLAVALPAVLCFVFLRLRRRPILQLAVLVAAFLAVEGWMHYVFKTRSNKALAASGSLIREETARHLGLNMYEELCWINTFISNGAYVPNWGERYFAEIVNPIPRVLWKNKPLIGIDYAIARGQGGGSGGQAGVHATISTGLIGQGLVNFSTLLGPLAAAFLMSIWVAILARFDLTADHLGRMLLYVLGLVLTFNLGRDFTLLVAYPLLFGYAISRYAENRRRKPRRFKMRPATT